LADKYHLKRPAPAEQEILRGYNARQVMQHLDVPWWKVPLLAHEFRTAMARDIDRIKLFEGVDQLFQHLTRLGITIAIVSSNSYKNIRHVLGAQNAARVSYYECGVSLLGKAAKIRKVLRQSRVKPSETILIGDEIRDGEAARQTHIAFGAVAWGYTRLEALQAQSPSAVFATMEEIEEISSMPQPAEIYTGLRHRILTTNPKEVGIEQDSTMPNVWGILMEFQIAGTVATLVALADGTTSLYFSNGGGILGTGQHDAVAKITKDFIARAEGFYTPMPQANGFPLPRPGRVKFYILTFSGIYTAEVAEADLVNGTDTLSPLFQAGNEVITQVRRHTPQK
jgi:phosphoglycolate phosphatase